VLDDAQRVEASPLDVARQAELFELRHSRDQLAAILGGIAEGVTVQDTDGALIFANDVAARLSGFASADEFLKSANVVQRFTLVDESGQPFPYDRLPGRRVLLGEEPEEVVVQFRNRDSGDWRWSILDAKPVRDEHGNVRMVVNIFRDITDRKRHADATDFLAAASTLLSSTLDMPTRLQNLAELVVSRIADWCIVDLAESDHAVSRVAVAHANPKDAELAHVIRQHRLEVTTHEALQPRSWIVLPLQARGRTLGSITLATAGAGRRYDQIDHTIAQDLAGRAALAIDSANLFREAQEQAEHYAVLNLALRETVEERDRALADLQQALRTRDEFLASASHDLKNPLASIKATAQLLERRLDRAGELDRERMREGLHRLDVIATRAGGLVDELLDLASLRMGRRLDLNRQPADLVELAREVAQERQLATERHTIRVDGPEARLIGLWDERRLGRVLANLLDNAVKYSPDGGPIDVRLQRDGDWVAIDVTDHGIGIPEHDQQRIFERFQRASNVEERIGGTGIGLASAWHILDSHGGTITVHSQEGSGTTFTVRLPIGIE
jgi:PAS domain S-box-containing protein